MRIFVIKQDTDLKGLGETLLKGSGRNAPASLERLQSLNPHVDINRLGAGTVLLVPDSPDFRTKDAETMGGTAFDDFEREIAGALRGASARSQEGLALREAQDKEVVKVFKSAAIGKLAADDSELRRRIDETGNRMAASSKETRQVTTQMDVLEKGVAAELKKLRQLAQ